MSLTIYVPGVLSCDHYKCDAKTEVRIELRENESESRADLNGFLSLNDFNMPDGWEREPFLGWSCPQHAPKTRRR